MIEPTTIAFLNGYTYIKKHPQLLLTILLVLLIPIGFLLSGQQFLNVAKQNQETLELERLGILHDTFASLVRVSGYNDQLIQAELEKLVQKNTDIEHIAILKEEKTTVRVIASKNPDEINQTEIDPDPYRATHINPNAPVAKQSASYGVRYWDTYSVLRSDTGDEYYMHVRTSLEKIDSSLSNRIIHAYYWLFGILAIVLLLLLRHVRLIDYAYLYTETKKANEMKDLFTNMIAHELRAPLTAMRGYASLIIEKSTDPETRAHAQRIQDASGRLVMIVNDLLDIARIHSGKLSVTPSYVNIVPSIQSALDALKVSAEEKKVTLTFDTQLKNLTLSIDEKRFIQAVTNLVSNAIKYTKAGSITVSLTELSDRIEMRVKDTGMGITAEDQKHLFAPFFRASNDDMKSVGGTGLGMWITKQLIELMRGSIGVESIKGVGTHVVVTLPKK